MHSTEKERRRDSITRARMKSTIVRLALTNRIPFKVADFLIQRGGLSHD